MRSLRFVTVALLLCMVGTGTAIANTGYWDVQPIASGVGNTVDVLVSPAVQMDTPCTTTSYWCNGSSSTTLLVSPIPVGKTGNFETYFASYANLCPYPGYDAWCLGGTHKLTLLRGVSYTFRGGFKEAWSGFNPVTGACDQVCENVVDFAPVTFVEAQGVTQPNLRLGWDTCDPYVRDKVFSGPAMYRLVMSVNNVTGSYSGYDFTVGFGPMVPDAWRFDAGGCQGDGNATYSTTGTKTCPSLQGSGPLAITFFGYDQILKTASLRLANTFNEFPADPATRYTLWVLDFNHAMSVVGPTTPGSCGGADDAMSIDVVKSEMLLTAGDLVHPLLDEAHAKWNGNPTPTVPTTWSRVKGMYR